MKDLHKEEKNTFTNILFDNSLITYSDKLIRLKQLRRKIDTSYITAVDIVILDRSRDARPEVQREKDGK